ncbi:MAG: hypothetical protein KBB21_23610 [Nannocystaceae bacterium]|nr:hypothetical protein [Deltaproteobacteria bacterium]MBP7289634.1 hypothetical protein [Nannocystaceae bacterium]
MSETQRPQPSIGNLLGLSLMLRDHRALLAVERRTLAPGVHLVDYEAVVPGVQFPLEGPLSASRFRHRRCAVQRMGLEVERHSVQAWLTARLLGRVVAGIRVETVEFEPAVTLREGDRPAPWIAIGGRGHAGAWAWFGTSLRVGGAGRCLALTPGHRWVFGRHHPGDDALWLALARALDPTRRGDQSEIRLDPAMEALRLPFVRAGWKLPALERLTLEHAVLDERRASAAWRSGATAPAPTPTPSADDPVPALCARVRAALVDHQATRACDAVDEVIEATRGLPMAQHAALRWAGELAAPLPGRRLAYLRARLRLRPTDRDANRRLVAALRAHGDHEELERHVRVWSQVLQGPAQRLRCALALTYAHAATGAFAQARAQLAACSHEPATPLLTAELARAHAFANLDDPPLALRTMTEATAQARPRARAQGFVDLGHAWLAVRNDAAAWSAVVAAIESGGGPAWAELAAELLDRSVPDATTHARLAAAAHELGDAELHRRLAAMADAQGDVHGALAHQWAAVQGAATHEDARVALDVYFAYAQVDLHHLAGIAAAATRPEVVAACERMLAVRPDHLASICVIAAASDDPDRIAALDAHVLALHGDDARAVPSWVRAAERAHAAGDHGAALALVDRVSAQPIRDEVDARWHERLARVADAIATIDPVARAHATIAALGHREHADAVITLAVALGRERDDGATALLVDALERLGAAAVAIERLRIRADDATDADERLRLRRRTAALLAAAGALDAAIDELTVARDEAPHDAAGWLALLELCFAEGALARAIAVVREMLSQLPMGDDAYAAAAARGVDAALALGDHAVAIELLDDVLARMPEHAATRARRQDVLATAVEPERRASLLANIAQRHTGAARIEALDERAHLLAEQLDRPDEAIADLARAIEEAPQRSDLAERLAGLYEQRERWNELSTLLRSTFARQRGTQRLHTLRRLAALLRDHLGDAPRAEQALRLAMELADGELADAAVADELRLELADVLERQGRWTDLAHELQHQLAQGGPPDAATSAARLALLGRLARLQREVLGDEDAAAATYELLASAGALPDEGLACLAHAHRRHRRFDDLVRVLDLRASALRDDPTRWAAVRLRVAELLDGPLARPHDAIAPYLDAFLSDPDGHREVGRRLRVLLAGVATPERVVARLQAQAVDRDEGRRAELETLTADVLAHHPEHASAAVEHYLAALELAPRTAGAIEGLARIELRRGALDIALAYVREGLQHPGIAPTVRAELATLAARSLARRDRDEEALALLSAALRDAPDHPHALLELASIHERAGRSVELGVVLAHLRELNLPASLRAQTHHRHAIALRDRWRRQPRGPEAEVALEDALAALQSDPTHPGARQILFELARLRDEWTLVVPALEAALRTLGPGPARARIELELGELALEHGDAVGACQRLAAAVVEIDDDEVERRATLLALRLPQPQQAADQLASTPPTTRALDPDARARIDRLLLRLREAGRSVAENDDELMAELERHRQRAQATGGTAARPAWLAAAKVAWHRLGDAERAAEALLHALGPDCDDDELPPLLGDVVLSCAQPLQEHVFAALAAIPETRIGPALRLERASLARLLGRTAEALEDLAHLSNSGDRDLRRRALAQLDHVLAEVAAPEDRVGVLRARLAELAMDDAPELADVAAELAALEYGGGDVTRALSTCRAGLRIEPQHRSLLRLQVELLDHHDMPGELASALVRYAEVCASPRERARNYVRAARIALDRGATAHTPSQRESAAASAADLLARAREADPDDLAARTLALPLAFAAGRGAELDSIGAWLQAHGRERDPVMIFAALHEVYAHGRDTWVRALGRIDAVHVARVLLPSLRQLASELAVRGPLDRMPPLLAAAAALVGGPLGLFEAAQRWAADRPLQSGLAWLLAQLHERHGDAQIAQRLTHVAAFLAGRGALADTLPPAIRFGEVHDDDDAGWLGGHAGIRAALAAMAALDTVPARRLPRRPEWTDDEQRFRECHAQVGHDSGLASLLADDEDTFADRLDALATLANPAHATTGVRARRFADVLAARPVALHAVTRVAMLGELEHWLATPERLHQLRGELSLRWWVTSIRTCEELRGALRTLAEEVGARQGTELDAVATLRSDRAERLLRALGLPGAAIASPRPADPRG